MQRKVLLCAAVAALWGVAVGVAPAGVGYTFDVSTNYQFGNGPVNFADMGSASPDSGWWSITNNGSTTFSGTIGQTAVSNFGGDHSYSHAVTLAPGQTVAFEVDDESSNYGGFNGAYLTLQPGVAIFMNGTVGGSEAVNLSVNDADIHSGVPRTNPFGVTTDAYVLQGGEPYGRDTFDDYEVSQAPGHFEFFENGPNPIPEPASLVLFGLGGVGLGVARLRRRLAK